MARNFAFERIVQKLGVLDKIADSLAKFAVFGGILFSSLSYCHSLESEKTAHVSTYIERYETGDTSKSVRAISQALRNFFEREDYLQIAEIVKSNACVSQNANEALWRLLVYGDDEGDDMANDLDNVVGFFNSLQTCVANSLCNHKVAHAFFDQSALTFIENFDGYIEDRRKTAKYFAKGLRAFYAEAVPPS